MPKQICALEGFDSIVYTRTCDVIATPMCTLAATPHCMTAALHCILEFRFGFGAIGDCRDDEYSFRVSLLLLNVSDKTQTEMYGYIAIATKIRFHFRFQDDPRPHLVTILGGCKIGR